MVDTIVLTSPKGGEVWIPGSTHNITWTSSGATLGTGVKIELFKGGILDKLIVLNTPIGTGSGSYSWTVPLIQTPGVDYKIRIMGCTLDATGNCIANPIGIANTFSIATPVGTLAVTSPTTGDTWEKGTIHNIIWTTTGNVKFGAKIELYKGGIFNRQIVYESPISGGNSYSWTVPTDLVVGSDYTIRIMGCELLETRCISLPIGISKVFTINTPTVTCGDPVCNLSIT